MIGCRPVLRGTSDDKLSHNAPGLSTRNGRSRVATENDHRPVTIPSDPVHLERFCGPSPGRTDALVAGATPAPGRARHRRAAPTVSACASSRPPCAVGCSPPRAGRRRGRRRPPACPSAAMPRSCPRSAATPGLPSRSRTPGRLIAGTPAPHQLGRSPSVGRTLPDRRTRTGRHLHRVPLVELVPALLLCGPVGRVVAPGRMGLG